VTGHKVAPRLAESSRSTYLICEDTGIRAARRREIATSITRFAHGVGPVETMRHFGHEQFSALWVPTIAVLAFASALSRLSRASKGCLMDIAPT